MQKINNKKSPFFITIVFIIAVSLVVFAFRVSNAAPSKDTPPDPIKIKGFVSTSPCPCRIPNSTCIDIATSAGGMKPVMIVSEETLPRSLMVPGLQVTISSYPLFLTDVCTDELVFQLKSLDGVGAF